MPIEQSLSYVISIAFDWLILLFLIETVVAILVNPQHHFGTVGNVEEDGIISKRSNTLRSRAATFTGLAIAIGTFILSSGLSTVEKTAPVRMVWLALAFLLISYQLKSLVRTDRLWYFLQERMFEYGFLSLIGAIFFLASVYSVFPAPYLQIGVAVVFLIRFRAVYVQLKGLRQMWIRSNEGSRLKYVIELIKERYNDMK